MRRLRRLVRLEGGYSLIEVLTVLVILAVVLAGVTTVFVEGSKAELDVNRRVQAQLDASLAFDKLRRDIHCATSATASGTGGSTLVVSGCTGGTVSWCVLSSTTFPPYALWRKVSSTCDNAGKFYAGNLTLTSLSRGALFLVPTAVSGSRPKVTVDVKVTPTFATAAEAFELIDDIVMRNATRAA